MQNEISPAAADAGLPIQPLAADGSRISPGYVLFIMTLVYVVNYLDRQILGILGPQIKAEFHLTNTQLGLLGGPAFAIVYATLGVPIAVLAERVSRRNIIAVSMALFSVMTVACGQAVQFWHLLLARFGTGIGEAGTGPSINSVIADLYPPKRRAAALSLYSAGLNIGLLIAFFGGGWLAEVYGWRITIMAAGIPGLALALVLLFTVKEPKRGVIEKLPDTKPPSLLSVFAHLWSQRSFRWFSIGTAMSAFGGYAGITFVPIFLVQTHHLSLHMVGLVLSILTGVFGALGTYLAGVFSDLLGKRDVRWNMYVPIVATFIGLPLAPVFYLASDTKIALLAAIGPSLVGAAFVGPAYAMTQALSPLRMRTRAAAILLFILNIIGYAPAAWIVGGISDALKPTLGADSLRYALMTGMITALIGAYCYWRASRTLKEDIARVTGS
jgi:predicted MFS family arabinose efflux permease